MKKAIKDKATQLVTQGLSLTGGIMISKGANSLIPEDKKTPLVHGAIAGSLLLAAVFMPGKGVIKEVAQYVCASAGAQQITEVVKKAASPYLPPATTPATKFLSAAVGSDQTATGVQGFRALRSAYSQQVLDAVNTQINNGPIAINIAG